MKILQQYWRDLVAKYSGNDKLRSAIWDEIETAYTHKSRYYHNFDHLEHMMAWVRQYESEIVDVDTVLFAIYYHDIVYNIASQDNELKSAELAVNRLQSLAVPDEQVERCRKQIMATKDHHFCDDQDAQYLVDIDLAILGEEQDLYDAYTKKIRKEYQVYPFFLYKQGRKKVLEHFLKMDRIYKTEALYNCLEEQARSNLLREFNRL